MKEIKLTPPTLEALAKLVIGNEEGNPKIKPRDELERFFKRGTLRETFDVKDFFAEGNETEIGFTVRMLRRFCKQPSEMRAIIGNVFHIARFSSNNSQDQLSVVERFQSLLQNDGYTLIHNESKNTYELSSSEIRRDLIETTSLRDLNCQEINEQISKVKDKFKNKDYKGTITNARALIEEVLSALIEQLSGEKFEHKGDLKKLFRKGKEVIFREDCWPKEIIEMYKQLMSGLDSIVSSIGGISNVQSERHAIKILPLEHQAKLVMGTAFVFCEFLAHYSKYLKKRKKGSITYHPA